jgi:hypothetical protein
MFKPNTWLGECPLWQVFSNRDFTVVLIAEVTVVVGTAINWQTVGGATIDWQTFGGRAMKDGDGENSHGSVKVRVDSTS